ALAADADRIAVVNGKNIPRDEYEREVSKIKDQISAQGGDITEPEMAEIKKHVIDNLVDMELLYQASVERGIAVSQKSIDDEWAKVKSRYPDENNLKKALDDLKVTEEIIKTQIRKGLSVNTFIEQNFVEKADIPESEAKAYYDNNVEQFNVPESVRASHILIKTGPDADENKKKAARSEIEKIQAKIKAGEDFAALARENSQCPSSNKGGDLGAFTRGQMVKPFEDAAFALAKGAVSDIVETEFGYHLIKVSEKQAAAKYSFDEVKANLVKIMRDTRVKKELSDYVKGLRKKARIETF
ncbi:MAG: peptidylprolyl isomerase, partial [Deltaproteobacteria bacterium]|nr:peptidylprolyl isomerase [Deltaproteobacteria bacterium]